MSIKTEKTRLLRAIGDDPDLFISVQVDFCKLDEDAHRLSVVEAFPGGSAIRITDSPPRELPLTEDTYGALIELIAERKLASVGLHADFGELYARL